jgi:hypothetical protein
LPPHTRSTDMGAWKALRICGLVLGWGVAGCARTPAPIEAPEQYPLVGDSGSDSTYGSSTSESTFGSGKGLSVPRRERPTDAARLVVRPDLYTLGYGVREVRETPQQALEAAQALNAWVEGSLRTALGDVVTTRPKGLSLYKITNAGKLVGFSATIDSVLDVRLNSAKDFWARSRLYAFILETTQALSQSAGSPQEPLRAVSFEAPSVRVEDPETYRDELVKRWVQRARAFASAAQSEHGPLEILDCAPPGPVTQRDLSLDEVTLELDVRCRIDVKGGSGSSAAHSNGAAD